MNPQIPKEYLSGNIERITYHNEDNGFCVLRVKVKGHKDLVTVTGSSPTLSVGEYIKCSGIWHNDRNYGKQFKADFLKALPPDTLEGIEKYLGSGLIKGIGPHFAKKLVSEFGDKVFSVIEETPELLVTLDGVGKVRANSICNNWKDQKVVREIMIFLQSHGVGTTRATRIFKTYGEDAISIVSRNPYQLAKDIRGIGFISADTIANNLGIEKNSLIRARAGLSHLLLEATSNGHCGLPQETLIENSIKLLEIDKSLIDIAIEQEISAKTIICDVIDDKTCVFLASYHFYEQQIARLLLSIKNSNIDWGDNNALDLLPQIEKELDIKLADNQKDAVVQALSEKLMVITGGPGTGKTTLIRTLLKILESKQLNIKLCAPTGRAAKRLSETTGLGATTIHRLLEIDPTQGGFKYNEDNKLACDYLIVDESSMIDVPLFHSLIKSLPDHAGLLLVGDVDQLPSVGAGQVLKDIISSNVITTIKLTQIFRQAATSDIITNAHNINKGILPKLDNPVDGTDFYFIQADPGDDIINKIIAITSDRIPKKFKLDPIHDIQLLCPMQRGGSGARSLNVELQKVLNPNYSDGIVKFGQTFAAGDKVMQTENNYDKDTYNGDIGVITGINQEEQEVVINFYGNEVIYEYADLDQITLAYATTIHKSQGSEYPAIIVPITMQSYLMLKRNLIYTAVTRGKKLVIVIGQKKALSMAIKDTKSSNRYSKLKDWLVY
ncbi:MAG: ATP-dependent RecD-like DNA helicase [Rickettsiaceae bacterium]|nr:ATP-dependent RecD-like DNA helicase [Rickettsiaceae bacterium]